MYLTIACVAAAVLGYLCGEEIARAICPKIFSHFFKKKS